MTDEITEQQAIETLKESGYELDVSVSDHELPNIELEAKRFEETGFLGRDEESVKFEKWQSDDAIEMMYEFVTSWADEKGYSVSVDRRDVFEQPIDEELLMNLEGSIGIGGKEIGFQYRGGYPRTRSDEPATRLEFEYGRLTGGNRQDRYDNFDASMNEEFRELYSLSETVLRQFGRVTDREPEL